jgi:tyrosine-protein kinase
MPAPRQEWALESYVASIRAHPLVVIGVMLAAIAASVAYLQLRSPSYEATAELLVEPLPQDDVTFLGLSSLIRDTGDPTRTAQTAAALVSSRAAADRAAEELGGDWTGRTVLGAVEVNPEGESNILGLKATAGSSEEAARVANEMADAALQVRNAELRDQAETVMSQLEARLEATPAADQVTRANLAARIDQLKTVIQNGDPTLTLSQEASPPVSAAGVPAMVVVILAAIAGLALGCGAALLLEVMTRRVSDEDEAADLYPIPALARVPIVPARGRRGPAGSRWYMPPAIREPFLTLSVQLDERDLGSRTIMVTSPSSRDGKTTSAINLAVSLAAGGRSVILLDFDLRKPEIASLLGVQDGRHFDELVEPEADIGRMLVRPSELATLRILPTTFDHHNAHLSDGASLPLQQLIVQAGELCDYVIVDTPPLGEVSDALRLLRAVDDILIVIRPGNSLRGDLGVVRELLERSGYVPEGSILIGVADRAGRGYRAYGYAQGYGVAGAPPDLVLEGSASPKPERQRRSVRAQR